MPKSDKSDTAVAAFGRFNPPTKGHLKLVNKLKSIPGDHYLFISHTQDAEKNPLDYDTKVSYAKKFFEGVHIGDKGCETIYDVLNKLKDMGYEHLVYVCGEDEYVPFGKIINEYNEKNKAFESVKIVQAGDREEDSEGTDGISATKVRKLAKDGDYEEFCDSIPDRKYAKGLYNDLRSAMKLDEDVLDEIEPNDIDMADAKAISGPIHNTILNSVNKNFINNVRHITVDGIEYPAGLYKDPKYRNTISVYVHDEGDLVAQLDLEPNNATILGKIFKIMIVDYAVVATNYQRKNIGFTLYKDLITKAKYNIGAYKSQSPGARILWKKLFADSEISLYASNDFIKKPGEVKPGEVEIYPVVIGPDGNLAAEVKGKVVSLYGFGNTMGIIATVKGGTLDQNILGDLVKRPVAKKSVAKKSVAKKSVAKKVRSEQVDEAHDFNYIYWGWIDADGKIYDNPKPTHTIHAEYVSDILKLADPNEYPQEIAFNRGWVRFFLNDSYEMFFSGYSYYFKLTEKIYTAIKQVLDRAHKRAHKVAKIPIFKSYNFENSRDRPLNPIEVKDPAEFLKKLRNKYRAVVADPDEFLKKLRNKYRAVSEMNEAHVFNYPYWGWISPVGEVFLPTRNDEGLHDHIIQHVTDPMIKSAERGNVTYPVIKSAEAGMKIGWVRFFIERGDNSMHFQTINIDKVNFSKVLYEIKSIVNMHLDCSTFNFEPGSYAKTRPIEEPNPRVFIMRVSNVLRMNEDIVHSKNGWTLFSKNTGKRLGGPYPSKEQAIKRERQVAYFKHMSENKIKTFNQFSEEQEDLQVDPKGDQEVLLEVTAPKEVKDNVTDGLDLRSKFNRGGNSDTIKIANKLLKEPFDESDLKNLLVKLTHHEKKKKTGWDDPKEPSDGFIAWMLLGGDAGKLWAEKSLSSTGKKKDPTVTEGVVDADNEYRLKHCVQLMNRIISEKKSDIFNSDTLQKLEELLLDIAEHDK